ncbi:Hypothetical_protein [Hexamita inflata]|uniref:Hypothetical_protein n=1 Tax=Hexamita inflata TaxID=28002 RepID=A0ABP1KRA3_9EUKA
MTCRSQSWLFPAYASLMYMAYFKLSTLQIISNDRYFDISRDISEKKRPQLDNSVEIEIQLIFICNLEVILFIIQYENTQISYLNTRQLSDQLVLVTPVSFEVQNDSLQFFD